MLDQGSRPMKHTFSFVRRQKINQKAIKTNAPVCPIALNTCALFSINLTDAACAAAALAPATLAAAALAAAI